MEQLELYIPKLEDLWFYQKMIRKENYGHWNFW